MSRSEPEIQVQPDGPYLVKGGLPLVRKRAEHTEHGEPVAWRKGETLLEDGEKEVYALCRCGHSQNKPFCDGAHTAAGFEGTETAPTDRYEERMKGYPGEGIELRDDRPLCVHAGFCGTRLTNAWKMTRKAEDTQVRSQIMAMAERCPSGALSYALEPGGEAIEPDLPKQVALLPDGPLWVTGGVPVTRADGKPLETRNRMTLCRCGASKNKPFCDGEHAEVGFEAE